MVRRKLFDDSYNNRRKLFSSQDCGEHDLKLVMCQDCGYQMETAAGIHATCPKCGGTRFNIVREFFSPENEPEGIPDSRPDLKKAFDFPTKKQKRFSDSTGRILMFYNGEDDELLFQREFSMPTSDFEFELRENSGNTLSSSEVERIFGMTSDELAEKTYASCDEDGNVSIDKNAYLDTKLFSKLIISVTKILDLDPSVTMEPNRENVLDMLESHGMPKKGIMIIKKSHCPIPTDEGYDDWCWNSK